MNEWVIQGVRLGDRSVDLGLDSGLILEISPAKTLRARRLFPAEGLIALPSAIDLHTHLRQPGDEESETVATGCRAARAGGYAAVFSMANTSPPQDCPEAIKKLAQLAKNQSVRVYPVGAVTQNLSGQRLTDIAAMARAGVRVFSDDGKCVQNASLMLQALEKLKPFDGFIAQHAEDSTLTEGAQVNAGPIAKRLGWKGWPGVAEESIVARDALLAEFVNSRVHICHVSTARSVEIIAWAKSRGAKITAEVTPHHLLLDEEIALTRDPRYKVNPPLRRRSDCMALRQAVAEGVIDVIATDHAPHAARDKGPDWIRAKPGMLGLETAVSVVQKTLVDAGAISWSDLARIMSHRPARLAGIKDLGQALEVGSRANFFLYNPNKPHVYAPEHVYSKSQNSPYLGIELPGEVTASFLGGKLVFSREGVL